MTVIAAIDPSHIVYIALSLTLVGFGGYYSARALKGKILIELPKEGYNGGEEITGRVTLVSRKALNLNRLYVALVGYEIVEKRDSNGKRSTRKNEVYRNEVNILEAQAVPAGLNQSFDFVMNAPGGRSEKVGEIAAKVADAVSTAATALSVLGVTTGHRRREWKLEARADLPGVDIAKFKKVRINTN